MKPEDTRRRSAFSVFRSKQVNLELSSADQTDQRPSSTKRRAHSQSVPVEGRKYTKIASPANLRTDKKENGVKTKGMTRREKVRQSLKLNKRKTPMSKQEVVQSDEVRKRIKTDKQQISKDPLEENESGVETEAEKTFQWLISPVTPQKFFSELWEKKPLVIRRHDKNYNKKWFSTEEFDRILREHRVLYGVNLDVTSYTDCQRHTHNPQGRALPPVVWDFYQNGCSLRMLNPQAFSYNIWKLNSQLQEFFGCFVGSNIYLTPPGTQGFAPHYDDIEAFIVQLEGKKHWKLYQPRTESEKLPRFSSVNFSQDEIGEVILDVVLEPGDLLYFPRGMIHQGCTPDDAHSLHITVSTYQKNSWGDLLEKLIPRSLEIALEEDLDFRKGLPVNFLDYMGVVHSDKTSSERSKFLKKVEHLMKKLVSYAPVDAVIDQMSKQMLHDYLPPVMTEEEETCSIFKTGAVWKDDGVTGKTTITLDTEVRLLRKGIIRMIVEEEFVCLQYSVENSRTYHELPPQYLEVDLGAALPIEHLLKEYPSFTKVQDLPHVEDDFKIDLVTILYEKGILVTKTPLSSS